MNYAEICKLNRARESEWYFFTLREKKYPNGCRPNRSAGDGFWKPTGTDKAIPNNKNPVGFRKSLDYYSRKQAEGRKTDWKMHEYLVNPKLISSATTSRPKCPLQPMLLDEWVLCKIYKTKAKRKKNNNDEDGGIAINSETKIPKADDSTAPPEYDNSLMIFEENENGFGSSYPPHLTLNNFVYDPSPMNNTLNHNFNYDPPPVNNTFSNSFVVYNVPPIQSYLPSSYSCDFQPIYGCGDQVCYSDCMEMPTINNHQSMPTEESIPSLPPVQSIYGYRDQVCYSDCMEMPTMNNHQSVPSEEPIPSVQPELNWVLNLALQDLPILI
ncbi:NAC domain-containing protein 2-like [Hevea brasiliensis]|uniref:NAC domain-containing protein 2-like n=1 Tax=Hevea brasiliensis TaxID=3981 RepID=UPI0025E1B548|nr:NAC domain-containing protein 2-like [Hevea brasiliensis]